MKNLNFFEKLVIAFLVAKFIALIIIVIQHYLNQ
jgi:hypothetical protein